MIGVRRSLADSRGVSAVEFALVAPVLLAFILMLIEGGRMVWTQQALQQVADQSARCMAVGPESCNTTAKVQTYAQTVAQSRGISIANGTITPSANQTCNAVTGMNKVEIVVPYQVATGLLPVGPRQLTASACYPSIG